MMRIKIYIIFIRIINTAIDDEDFVLKNYTSVGKSDSCFKIYKYIVPFHKLIKDIRVIRYSH